VITNGNQAERIFAFSRIIENREKRRELGSSNSHANQKENPGAAVGMSLASTI